MATLEREGVVAVGSRDALYDPSCLERGSCEMVPDDLPARIASKIRVNETTGCWEWTASIRYDGYGQINWHRKVPWRAHRLVYELMVGPIPEGLTIDHLCRVRHCVNPAHLEPVTMRENVLRGTAPAAIHAAQTHCIRGHVLLGDNLAIARGKYGPRRRCRQCKRDRYKRLYALPAGQMRKLKTHCKYGHAFTEENIRMIDGGNGKQVRQCIACDLRRYGRAKSSG